MIDFNSVNKSFSSRRQKFLAVDNVSFSISPTESIGFIGHNGAGKSTSIKMMMGMFSPDSGSIHLMGMLPEDPKSRERVGYVPENPYLYDYLTPLEVVRMGLEIHGVAKGTDSKNRAMDWLERFDIGYAANKRIRNLSKGMTQRTALAHAMAIDPKLLVLDEPMSGLDPAGRKLVADILQEYRQQGGTVFFCSHILNDVERLASRVLLMHKGRLRVDKPLSEILKGGNVLVRYQGAHCLENFVSDGQNIWRGECSKQGIEAVLQQIHQCGGELVDVQNAFALERLFTQIETEET